MFLVCKVLFSWKRGVGEIAVVVFAIIRSAACFVFSLRFLRCCTFVIVVVVRVI